MKDELYLKKIRAEYEYLKAEEQYQKKIFDKANPDDLNGENWYLSFATLNSLKSRSLSY